MKTQSLDFIQNNFSVFSIFKSADLASKFIILTLLFLSIYSWSIFILKFIDFNYISKNMKSFLSNFEINKNLKKSYYNAKNLPPNPLTKIFLYTLKTLNSSEIQELPDLAKLKTIKKTSQICSSKILLSLERSLPNLGTISSISPFIGLLGTIIGIVKSFQSIANTKSANISVVAPGIAEALFVTALGLFVLFHH